MIIIPDVHGRKFWKEAVKKAKDNEKIIFLGDYTDPYGWEGISKDECFDSLNDIIDFKLNNKDNVILLLGNHDLSYMDDRMVKCRHDYLHHDYINEILKENIDLFNLAYECEFDGMKYIFSHSGIIPKWIRNHEDFENIEHMDSSDYVKFLNDKLHNDFKYIVGWLMDVSPNRGGFRYDVGSCVWGDLGEFLNCYQLGEEYRISDVYQVFGHTQLQRDPVIAGDFACLDCRKGFRINDNGEIKELDSDE